MRLNSVPELGPAPGLRSALVVVNFICYTSFSLLISLFCFYLLSRRCNNKTSMNDTKPELDATAEAVVCGITGSRRVGSSVDCSNVGFICIGGPYRGGAYDSKIMNEHINKQNEYINKQRPAEKKGSELIDKLTFRDSEEFTTSCRYRCQSDKVFINNDVTA